MSDDDREAQQGEVVVFAAPDGAVQVQVLLSDETVWLTQRQMAELFDTTVANVNIHLRNVYEEGELASEATIKESLTVRSEGGCQVRRKVQQYNLDVIISVGYRVKSQRGTQFRIWATGILNEHLVRGVTVNEHRLRSLGIEAQEFLALVTRTLGPHEQLSDEGRDILDIANRYAKAWGLLRAYDEDTPPDLPSQASTPIATLDVEDARAILKAAAAGITESGQPLGLFGRENGERLEGALMAFEQTWAGEPLYPTIELRAAHLPYFLVKDHPLADGNKRAGALLFVEYLHRNRALLDSAGRPRISNSAPYGPDAPRGGKPSGQEGLHRGPDLEYPGRTGCRAGGASDCGTHACVSEVAVTARVSIPTHQAIRNNS